MLCYMLIVICHGCIHIIIKALLDSYMNSMMVICLIIMLLPILFTWKFIIVDDDVVSGYFSSIGAVKWLV